MKTSPLIIASLFLASSAAAQTYEHPTVEVNPQNGSPANVSGYIVSNNGSNCMTPQCIAFGNGGSADGTININTSDRKQRMDGFGYGITGSASYNLMHMSAADRHRFLVKTFSPTEGYGASYIRVPIGCSDYSLSEYTCRDDRSKPFALTYEETEYIIPVVKEILEINPNVKVMGSPWTAPRWMKKSNDWTSAELSTSYYQEYADYFVSWIKAMQAEGIRIYAITQQNEPLNKGNSASMYMPADQAAAFAKTLGPTLNNNGLADVKVYCYDHNYDHYEYPINVYNDQTARQYIDGAGFHNYGGSASNMSTVHNQYPDKELIFTEWTAGTWSHGVDISETTSDVKSLVFDVVKNWGQGAMVWNLMLDDDRGPYRPKGCCTGNGAVDISRSDYKTIVYNSFYYTMSLASSVIKPGANYIGTSDPTSGVEYVAFDNNDGTHSMVITNTNGSEKKIRVNDGGNSFVVTLPANTAGAFIW